MNEDGMQRLLPVCVAGCVWVAACAGSGSPAPSGSATSSSSSTSSGGGVEDAGGGADAASMDDAAMVEPDAGTTTVMDAGVAAMDAGQDAGVTLVDVSHARELRGAWVATVANINFPSRNNLTASAAQAEIVSLVEGLAAKGINAIFFQVRPESDALYASSLEPWGRVLTGVQGRDPGYDPLEFLIGQAHGHGMEVHAWLNPYRGLTSTSVTAAANHVTRTLAAHAITYNGGVWMDPGADAVRQHVVDVVEDIVSRYDVSGIHFDDYFYPYPASGQTFDDAASFQAYGAAGGTLGKDAWRRENVNQLIEQVSASITAIKPHVRFGVSPFGIYRPGTPAGITGLDAYTSLACDPVTWMQQGWVDYLAPQLYWPTTQTAQAYRPLLDWWSSLTWGGRSIFAGINLTSLGSTSAWTVDEIVRQVQHSRDDRALGSLGNIFFHMDPLLEDPQGLATRLHSTFYALPALPPPVAAMAGVVVEPPVVQVMGTQVITTHPHLQDVRAWVFYRQGPQGFAVEHIYPSRQLAVVMPAGTYAVTAVGQHDVESQGVLVTVQ